MSDANAIMQGIVSLVVMVAVFRALRTIDMRVADEPCTCGQDEACMCQWEREEAARRLPEARLLK